MPEPVDKRGKLDEGVFSYQVTQDGRALLYWMGRHVKTLAGKDAQKFLIAIDACHNEKAAQLVMAKTTGNFKRGNERSN
ncbi:MAG: hypothetical protein MUF38_20450 [Anaerolineae bacterium]|jgi:hypothetical protein|nr:hypothetical protein [Anaerolineae bacterium]